MTFVFIVQIAALLAGLGVGVNERRFKSGVQAYAGVNVIAAFLCAVVFGPGLVFVTVAEIFST